MWNRRRVPVWTLVSLACCAPTLVAQQAASESSARETLLQVARETMLAARIATLVTLDTTGHPQARVVDAFAPDADMVVRVGTSRRTRKVDEIRRDPRVTLSYFDPASSGYVTLRGIATLTADPAEAARWWKPEWEAFYPAGREDYLLIVITPERLEVVSEGRGVVGDPETWRPPTVVFDRGP